MNQLPPVFTSPGLVRREHYHRRLLLLGLSSLLLLSILPTIGHHLPGGLNEPLGSIDHLGAFCAAALRLLFTPVHGLFHIALAIGLVYALWDRVSAWHSLRSTLNALNGESPRTQTAFWCSARRARIAVDRVVIVAGLPNPVFTAGLLTPRIYVSADLERRLNQTELDCVIAHEAAHVRRRDPLRLTVYRFLSCLLFWMPALKGLATDISDEAEIEADNAAAQLNSLALASAILQLASAPGLIALSPVVSRFSHPDLLERRIRRLAGENTALPTRVRRRSVIMAGFALFLAMGSGLAAAKSPGGHTRLVEENHCNHHHGSLWSHLRCSSTDCNALSEHCDHG